MGGGHSREGERCREEQILSKKQWSLTSSNSSLYLHFPADDPMICLSDR